MLISGCTSSISDPESKDDLGSTTDPDSVVPNEAVVSNESVVPIESTGADDQRDLIRSSDPSAFSCLVDLGVQPGEFFDKGIDDLVFSEEAHFFEARYSDGSVIEIRIHGNVIDNNASAQAERIADPVGRLPVELRSDIERIGLLAGDHSAQGDGGGEGIHLYEENVARREASSRLEETLFHESVHTSLDDLYGDSPEWKAAQAADGNFLTAYARQAPKGEDLAETALYAYALLYHPDRISAADADAWRELVPNRIAFIETILPKASNVPGGDELCAA